MKSQSDLVVRKALPGDMEAIFSFGYDAWGEGKSLSEHIAICQNAKKYTYGTWYVLTQNLVPVSALICYRDAFNLAPGIIGIGSVATAPTVRRRGCASKLLEFVLTALAETEVVAAFFLFSEVDPQIYVRLGFVALPQKHQKFSASIAMICPVRKRLEELLAADFVAPTYF